MNRSPLIIATLLAVATLVVSVAISYLRPPIPRVHDEFAYLLAGDTYAHGRAANPQHPMWRHFEAPHVLQYPTYASKYPPGQGLLLALGQRSTGLPIAGVWITSALAVIACYWMLLGMVPPRWAALGGAALVVHPGLQLTWGQSYWGGTLAFAAGALLIGAAARLSHPARDVRLLDAMLLTTGALLLAVTRPFEGLVTCLLVAVWVVARWTRFGWPAWRPLVVRVLAPQFCLLLLGALWLAEYNHAVTGCAFRMPYQWHEQLYGMCPLFLFGEPAAQHSYLHESLRQFHAEWSMDWFDKQQSLAGLAQTKLGFLYYVAMVLMPLPLLAPVALFPWWRGTKLRGPLCVAIATWLVTQVTVWNWPHYIAPVAPVVLLVAVSGLRNLRVLTRHWTWAAATPRLVVYAQAAMFLWAATTWVQEPAGGWHWYRHALAEHLTSQPGRHLVLVEYTPMHEPLEEWVYNQADIDHAKVIWAHAMSPTENAELASYFHDRKIWRLAADLPQPRLAPYHTPQTEPLADTR